MTYRKKIGGFTLIELVLVITIIGVISVVVGRILLQSFQSFRAAENITLIDWQGALIMNRFATDVHSIRSANDITTISATTFTFVDVSGATVTYQLAGSSLLRSGTVLATGVSSMALAYYDKDYVVTATPTNVRYIALSTNLTQSPLTQTFSTLVGTRGMP